MDIYCSMSSQNNLLRSNEKALSKQDLEFRDMILSIPLFSPPLLVAAALMAIGLLLYPFSARLAVAGIGAGSVIMGMAVLAELPKGFEMQAAMLFGIAVVVGGWMMFIAAKNG